MVRAEEGIPLLYREALRFSFASLQPQVSQDENAECKIMTPELDDTYPGGLAGPSQPLDTEFPYPEDPCCLASVIPLPPELGL